MSQEQRKSRALARVALMAFLVLLVGLLVGVHAVWNPHEDSPSNVDAVVVLSSGEDRRVKGREIVAKSDVSDVLVYSLSNRLRRQIAEGDVTVVDAPRDGELKGNQIEECGADLGPYAVLCVYPRPNSTAGEALAVAELAESEGWDSVLIVTERSHLLRARTTFSRCVPEWLQVYVSASPGPSSLGEKAYRTVYELLATARDLFVDPCPDR